MRKTDVIGWTIITILSIYFLMVSWYEYENSNDSGGDQYERIK